VQGFAYDTEDLGGTADKSVENGASFVFYEDVCCGWEGELFSTTVAPEEVEPVSLVSLIANEIGATLTMLMP
jgi:hypothetical protein